MTPKTTNKLEEKIRQLSIENERLKNFLEIEKSFGSERDLDKLLPLIMARISKAIDADRSTLFLVDWDRMTLWTKFAEGLKSDTISIKLKMGLVGLSVITKQSVNLANAYEDPRFNPEIDELSGFRTESILVAPIFDKKGEVIGAVELLNRQTGRFTEEDEKKVVEITSNFHEVESISEKDRKKASKLIKELRALTDCARGSFFYLDKEKGELFTIVSEGLKGKDIFLNTNLGIAGVVAITGQSFNIPDVYTDPRFDQTTDEKTGYRTRCIACVPIKNQFGEILGVIEAINKNLDVFSDSDMEILEALASIVAIPIENATLFAEQRRQFKSILKVMAASIDAKDPLTAGHSEKVNEYSKGIARELGFGETEIDVLSVAALLHDYGKIGIDDIILKKKNELTPDEYDIVKQHVMITKNILEKMRLSRKYRTVPFVASCHHEVLDGSGYMKGIQSNDIPFMAKILTVADVFEALTADRHYRKAFSPKAAFEILDENKGVKYDETIIEALKSFWAKKGDR